MRKLTKFAILISLVGFIAISGQRARAAINLTVTGSWNLNITAGDLISGAGSDLKSTYESDKRAITIDITRSEKNWQVDVCKSDTNWPNNFHLYVKRTSNGSGSGNISGGTTYQEVTDTDKYFFSGEKKCRRINIQLKLSGVSIAIPPNSYITTIIYTVTEI